MAGVHNIYSGNVRGMLQEHIMQYCCHKGIVFNDQGPYMLHTLIIFRERYIIILPCLCPAMGFLYPAGGSKHGLSADHIPFDKSGYLTISRMEYKRTSRPRFGQQ